MSIDNFTPALWAAELLENLNTAHVAANVVNRDYEGDIKAAGDTVQINSIGRVTIGSYTKNSNIGDPETLDDSMLSLVIDQAKYYNFQVDNIDKAQNKPKVMSAAMEEAAWGLADVSDRFLIALLYAGVASASPDNLLTSRALGVGAADEDAYETLVDLGVKLDESDVPSGNRWVLIPPWVHGLLLKDPRFVSFGTEENIELRKGGAIGTIEAGFTVYKSNNIYPALSSVYAMIAGSKMAATFAEQVVETEAYKPEKRFADALKGLHVYGAKVARPNALAALPVTVA